ncbi:PhoH family protein [Pisciglobus halotolerans]|uniref:PhoH-like protein n=1 Tax=Pisciglobus halotolerans TaxID=745365 RepID=A0A1I3B9R0_9LACT|nr:phosphate starvation-inducible protein PhoH [Pisciglobus halotolerans]
MAELANETRELQLKDPALAQSLYGAQDKHLKLLEDNMEVVINSRGDQLLIVGSKEKIDQTADILIQLQELLHSGIQIGQADVVTAIKMANRGTLSRFVSMYEEELGRDFNGRAIRVKTFGQRQYVQAIKKNDVVFGIGPAGTGKTYLAVVMAVAALRKGEVKRIILTRPAVEAGENLGFLPGDLKEKVDPYLRPIYDALYNIFGLEHTTRLMDRGVIEIAPLAYMRGRTLDDAFVILDEAQNTTIPQMRMFLTRLGFGSKMIINGDVTQIDLPRGTTSGLINAERVLREVKKIKFISFDATDVVRHPVVADIILAYNEETTHAQLNQQAENDLKNE